MARRPKVGRPLGLTPEVQETICANIRRGAYAWVAAQAAGIGASTFQTWMASADPRFREFQEEVHKARAEARLRAEQAVMQDKPEFWLRVGPGRERPGEPGWTDSVQHSGSEGGPLQVQVSINRLVPRGDK